ncbi:MAG: DUF3365 domain-containing protein [Spirulinaceae cyanobacterium]
MLKKLKLGVKFTLVLGFIFIVGTSLSYTVLTQTQELAAQKIVKEQAILLMDTMSALRDFHSTQISPLIKPRLESSPEFIPEVIPSFTVRQVFEEFRQKEEYLHYLYKDATLHPTNLRDKADQFEAKLVGDFRQDSELKELYGFRPLKQEKLFYIARPLKITKANCLVCHNTPEEAPASLIKTYGSENGFGWKLNEIIGAQTIYIPASDIFALARRNGLVAIATFMVIFTLVLLVINSLLKRTVVEPLKPMASLAQQMVTREDSSAPEKVGDEVDLEKLSKIAKRYDELGQLAKIFQQMAYAIHSREQGFVQKLQALLEADKTNTESLSQKDKLQRLLARSKGLRHNSKS